MNTRLSLKSIYHSPEFLRSLPKDSEVFGAVCSDRKTSFALWSPLAKSVRVLLFPDGEQSDCMRFLPMTQDSHGVWKADIPENLHGTYYLYEIRHNTETVTTCDPYARACGLNGTRSMVVDLRLTDPPGWEQDRPPEKGPETIVTELHIKEFSWQPAGGFPEALRGTYKAFACTDTSLHGDGIHPTGIPYLQKLGVTHVQLMPFFDYGSVEESDREDFNWGYDPVNYNVPEGSYATDPRHGEIRIRECKEMIQALHRSGFRVIMDVVYNHTYTLDSCLNRAVPWYYYRLDESGSASNGSGCGNDIATEEPMCSRYILDSVLYWAREYHVDGFRFDLMGLMDVALINRIRAELDRIYGKGEKLIYGEPWAASPSAMLPQSLPADKAHMKLLDPGVGMFCDNTRDSIKGNVFLEDDPGFINGGTGLEKQILRSVCAWCDSPSLLQAPAQHIIYTSAHDNLTLWDKLCCTVSEKQDLISCNKLAAAITFTCQGIPFFLCGEEFARTKHGLDNTYNAPISLNRLDWEQAWENEELHRYYAGLIALRKQCPGLWDKSPSAVSRISDQWFDEQAVGFCVNNQSPDIPARWNTLCILYNSRKQPLSVPLPLGRWQILVNDRDSFCWQKTSSVTGQTELAPLSAMILGKTSET